MTLGDIIWGIAHTAFEFIVLSAFCLMVLLWSAILGG
jgi:hypothetical protein